jgi:putative hemolysin
MMTDTFSFDTAPAYDVKLTYAHPGQSLQRRWLIHAVEWLCGQPKLAALYREWAGYGKRPGEAVFDAALRVLQVTPQLSGVANLARIPTGGGLLLVANHPFGILDGLALGHLGMRLRGNVRILTNSLLCRVPEVAPYLLPVDFSGTAAARRLTSETRRQAMALLAAGQVVAVFPAGGVATANAPVRGRAFDAPWHPFVGRLATLPGVTTLPLHFGGQNSRLFQIASHTSYALRVALIFHETRRRIGDPLAVTIGAPINAASLCHLDRGTVAETLRRATMALASPAANDLDTVFVWPRHIRW